MVRHSSALREVWLLSRCVKLKFVAAAVLGSVVMMVSVCGRAPSSNVGTAQQLPETPPLEYCELANHPEKYDGQTVRVSATLYFMMHGYKFMDKGCLGDDKETAVLLDGEHEAKLAKEMGMDEYIPWNFPEIVATGKFRRVTPNRKSDTVADNSNLIFEMETVERVIKYPNR